MIESALLWSDLSVNHTRIRLSDKSVSTESSDLPMSIPIVEVILVLVLIRNVGEVSIAVRIIDHSDPFDILFVLDHCQDITSHGVMELLMVAMV